MNPQDSNNQPNTPPQAGSSEPSGAPSLGNDQVSDNRRPVPVSDFRPAPGPAPAQDIRPAAPPTASAPSAPQDAPADKPSDEAPKSAAPPSRPKSPKPLGAVIAAVFIGLLLAGVSVFAYLKTKGADKPAPKPQASQTSVKPQDVDNTAQEIDKTLESASQAEDLGEGDLTDQSLGL